MVGYFLSSGIRIEGAILGKINGWYTLRSFFRGNIYKVRQGKLFKGYAPLPY
jgi:hypothetical protein